MIDIKLIRENPEIVRESQKKRGLDVKEIDTLLGLDKKWREIKRENDNLRSERNKISEKINEAKKQKDNKLAEDLIKEAKEIPAKIEENERLMKDKEDARNS